MKSRRVWLVVGVAALVGAAIGLAARHPLGERTVTATEHGATSGPTLAANASELASDAASVGHVVYWAGPVAGRRYELTQTEDGRAYVRYLPRGVEVGDPRPGFLTVGTYLLEDAYSVTQAASRRGDARTVQAPAGAVAFYTTARPQSVYLAYEGSDLQIELFHPTPRQARKLVSSGRVRPVG